MTEPNEHRTWRRMAEADLDAVAAIAVVAFPHHFEGRACFANRLAIYPKGCFVFSGHDERAAGYLIAYPWKTDSAPALNTLVEAIPRDADLIYLHDLALLLRTRGAGHARVIVEKLAAEVRAEGWPAMALVAVNDATAFWERLGFQVRDTPELQEQLSTYGSDARYLVRKLD